MHRLLIPLFLALMAGIIAGSYFISCYDLLFIAVILNLFFLLITIRKKWLITGFFLILSFTFLLGVFDIQKQNYFIENSQSIGRYIDQGKVTLEGTVIENPLAYIDKNVLIVRTLRVIKDKSYIPVSGDIRLAIPPDLNFQYGDFIRFHSTLKKIQSFKNPGNFNYERILSFRGISASGFISNSSGIILLRNNSLSSIRLKLESFRLYLKQIIYRNASSPQREVLEAMTIGNQNEIPADVRDNFNKTGTSHILSISGLHIGMVGAITFLFIFFILKISEYMMLRFNVIKLAATAAFFMVLIYACIAGMGVAVMRTTLMAFIFLIALLLGKQKDLYNTLAAAGLMILVISPEAVFDISFQLSFLSVLALIYIVPRFSDIPFMKHSTLPLWMQGVIRYLYLSIIVCLAATIGTLPFIMYYFNRVSSVTIIANLIAVPLLGTLTLAISMLFILSAFFSPAIAGYFIKLASYFTELSINIINKLAALPFSYFTATTPNIIEIIFFYLFIFLVIQFIDERKKKNIKDGFSPVRFRILKYLLVMTIIFFIADTTYLAVRDKFSSDLKITVMDVGQGNSNLIQFPGGKKMVIDGGGFSESSFDVGKAVIAPFLYHQRISHIDTAVLSHPHPDHLLGLIYILNNFGTGQVWKSNLPVDSETFPEWEKTIRLNNIHIDPVSNKDPERILNGVRVKVLWPPDYSLQDINDLSYGEANDSSLVLKITFGKINFLFPGDISSDIEKQLIQSKADLQSDVLVVPHHGSNHSSSAEFIKAVACRYAIVSAGKSNVFKHPHPSVLERYQEAGVMVFRTDRDGAISLTTDGNNLHIDTFIKNR
ncbi:MAG: DNA internalization-related competence protein ComEC/Rec2 [Deltaproteobacteria bacterium HGW-Deltaproteobacteria-13]|jgi:competence protein ComEC|nr:MAG: DNA internalization-related competence protein ComEC/Rec2 [Deltaproteobacteria bacterium HGW-Deltaproteobacteria-13]